MTKRYPSFDIIRGTGILIVVLLHAALYQYGELLSIDFENPPLIITIIGFLLMWAGLFAMLSAAAYGATALSRYENDHRTRRSILADYLKAGVVLLVLSYIYFILLGPGLLDLEHGEHDFSIIFGVLRHGELRGPSSKRLFYNTSLSMLAHNMLILAPVVYLVVALRPKTRRIILIASAAAVFALSYIRIPIFSRGAEIKEKGNWILYFCWAIFFNKNDPILPYLGFGLLGTCLGFDIHSEESRKKTSILYIAIGAIWTIAGIVGFLSLPDTMLERSIDEFWFAAILFQGGVFLLILLGSHLIFDHHRVFGKRGVLMIGSVSLTLFLLETPFTEVFAKLSTILIPGWNSSLPGTLLFALIMALFWYGVTHLWKRAGFRFSAEWLIMQIYKLVKRESGKEWPLSS